MSRIFQQMLATPTMSSPRFSKRMRTHVMAIIQCPFDWLPSGPPCPRDLPLSFTKLPQQESRASFWPICSFDHLSVFPLDGFPVFGRLSPLCKKTTDVQAWIGLVTHVSHYKQLIKLVDLFRTFIGKTIGLNGTTTYSEHFRNPKQLYN